MITLEIPAPEFARRFASGEIPPDARVTVTYEGREAPSPGAAANGTVASGNLVLAKLHAWQEETATRTTPAIATQELFAQWDAQDAAMSEEERLAESQLWDAFEKGINDNRAALGMRAL